MMLQICHPCLGSPWNGLKQLFPKIVGMENCKNIAFAHVNAILLLGSDLLCIAGQF